MILQSVKFICTKIVAQHVNAQARLHKKAMKLMRGRLQLPMDTMCHISYSSTKSSLASSRMICYNSEYCLVKYGTLPSIVFSQFKW